MLDTDAVEPRTVDFSGVDAMTIATRLREGRDAIGLTRKKVADATGVPLKSLEKYENGQMEPSVSRLRALANFLGLDFLELVDEAQEHGRAVPLKNPAPASKVGDTRDLLKQLAKNYGMELVTTEQLRDGGTWAAPAAATLLDSNGLNVDLSPSRRLIELSQLVSSNGANSSQVRRAIRKAKEDIEDLDDIELIDLADDMGLYDVPEEADIDDAETDEGELHTKEGLIARILVSAVFGCEPNDLTSDALDKLYEELIELNGSEPEEVPPTGFFGGPIEGTFDSMQRIASKMMLKALLNRQAPDIANRKAYPKREENSAS